MLGQGERGGVERDGGSFADLAQGPVDGFFHKIAFVGRGLLDERQQGDEGGIGLLFGVHRKGREQGEGGAACELGFALGPFAHLGKGVGAVTKRVEAHLVAHVPAVEGRDPGVHELGGELLRIGDERGQDLGFVNRQGPEREGEGLVAAMGLGERTKRGYGAAQLFGARADAKAVLSGNVRRVALGA